MKKSSLVNQVITEENVVHIGEMIAVSALKKMLAFSGQSLNRLYAELVHDVFDYKELNEPYSYGYDIASEVICFLCRYIGNNLGDTICKDRKNNYISIRNAAYKCAFRYIEKERMVIYHIKSMQDVAPIDISVELKFEEKEDYTTVDTLVEKMRLTDYEIETLNHYMAGLGFVETAKILEVANTTIWRRIKSIQNKYCKYIGNY